MQRDYVIGIDFGTDSVRVLVVDAGNGKEESSSIQFYPRWAKGAYIDRAHKVYRQHPLDYIESMTEGIREAVGKLRRGAVDCIRGLALDTTGSTPGPLDEHAVPLAMNPRMKDDPDAMFVLWKDHSAEQEANEINELAQNWQVDYTAYSGGLYSPEWFWSKILHVIKNNDTIRSKAYSWAEHCDWIPALLTGNNDPLTWKRSRSAAGHKAMWHPTFDGLPSSEFLEQLHPYLGELRSRLYHQSYEANIPAGRLCREWAERLGLPEGIIIGTGSLDAHVGAVGAGIDNYTMVKVVGTSTCDMVVVPQAAFRNKMVGGICGQVEGSILPGLLGLEAGQSAFGDVYQWYVQLLTYGVSHGCEGLIDMRQLPAIQGRLMDQLNHEAAMLEVDESDPMALDWINGRRTPDADLSLKAAISGLHLGTDNASIFKALVEATAFGSRAILSRLEAEGVPVKRVIAVGGISKKSPYIMQTLSSVMNRPIQVGRATETCALGAAILASVACGIHPNVKVAQQKMCSRIEKEYKPDRQKTAIYEKRFRRYLRLGDLVGKL